MKLMQVCTTHNMQWSQQLVSFSQEKFDSLLSSALGVISSFQRILQEKYQSSSTILLQFFKIKFHEFILTFSLHSNVSCFRKCLSSEVGIIVPARYQACVMPQDCILSEWSDWTPCPITCPPPYGIASQDRPTTKRTRRRHVQMLPLGAGRLCPKLEDEQDCQIEEGVSISTEDCPR